MDVIKMKAVIFDLDGVLVFTDKFHYLAWKKIADRMGIDFNEQVGNRLRGVSRMDSLEIILERYNGPKLSGNQKQQLTEEKNEYYKEYIKTMTPDDIQQEVRGTLIELRNRGFILGIGSSSKNARYILNQTKLGQYFDAISDGTNITKSKPDPEVYLKAAEYLGVNPKNCYVVEDGCAGVDAAKAGGMTAIGIGAAADYERTDISIQRISEITELV